PSPPTLYVEITNRSIQPITVKCRGHLRYRFPWSPDWPAGPSNRDHVTYTGRPLNLTHFAAYAAGSDADFMGVKPHEYICTTTVGRGQAKGWPRSHFNTLMPGVRLIRSMPFPPNSNWLRERMRGDGEYRLTLRPEGVWWCVGTVDELFGGEVERVLSRSPT
ncbi:hypothetical protein LTR60_005824, partial [Cryomyces antarcticus]